MSPDTVQLSSRVAATRQQLTRTLHRHIETLQQQIDHAARGLLSPHERLARARDRVALAAAQIGHAMTMQRDRAENQLRFNRQRLINSKPNITDYQAPLMRCRNQLKMALHRHTQQRLTRLEAIRRNLSLLSPNLVLERGYSIVERRGLILRNAHDVATGDALSVRLANGRIAVLVTATASDRMPDGNGNPA